MAGTGFPQTVKTVRVIQVPGSSNQDQGELAFEKSELDCFFLLSVRV